MDEKKAQFIIHLFECKMKYYTAQTVKSWVYELRDISVENVEAAMNTLLAKKITELDTFVFKDAVNNPMNYSTGPHYEIREFKRPAQIEDKTDD